MANDSIRIGGNIKKIEVNDNGEYISINIADPAFMGRLAEVKAKLETKVDDLAPRLQEIDAMPVDTEKQQFEKTRAIITLEEAVSRETMADIDALFHDEVCRKVFGGDVVPDVLMIAEFFEKLTPYLQKYSQERAQSMSKYNPNRTGSV